MVSELWYPGKRLGPLSETVKEGRGDDESKRLFLSSQGNDTPLRPCRRTGITGTTRTCRRYKVMVDSQLHPNTPRGVRKLNQTCPDKSENLLPKGCIRSLPLTSRVAELAPCVRLRDHPRVCGEQLGAGVVAVGKKGSSPRVRGAEVDLRAPRPLSGIIPACAGSRARRRPCRR